MNQGTLERSLKNIHKENIQRKNVLCSVFSEAERTRVREAERREGER